MCPSIRLLESGSTQRAGTGARHVVVARQRVAHQQRRIGVVVQRMIEPDCAGVMFTRNPVNGADERVIEASWGLGEAVVAGLVGLLRAASPSVMRERCAKSIGPSSGASGGEDIHSIRSR